MGLQCQRDPGQPGQRLGECSQTHADNGALLLTRFWAAASEPCGQCAAFGRAEAACGESWPLQPARRRQSIVQMRTVMQGLGLTC